jgi:hypothetical protein
MNQISLFPILAGALFIAAGIHNIGTTGRFKKFAWIAPAMLSTFFLMLSLQAVVAEGPSGFWTEHTRNLWGNQIWYDLLLALGAAWYFAAKKARILGLRSWPWLLAIIATGSIGLLAFLARVLYVDSRSASADS